MRENSRPKYKIWDLLVGYCTGEKSPRMIEVSSIRKTPDLYWVYEDDDGHQITQGNIDHAYDADKKKWVL
jgi:hypothetical protein